MIGIKYGIAGSTGWSNVLFRVRQSLRRRSGLRFWFDRRLTIGSSDRWLWLRWSKERGACDTATTRALV
jgi:hypothetical protein